MASNNRRDRCLCRLDRAMANGCTAFVFDDSIGTMSTRPASALASVA